MLPLPWLCETFSKHTVLSNKSCTSHCSAQPYVTGSTAARPPAAAQPSEGLGTLSSCVRLEQNQGSGAPVNALSKTVRSSALTELQLYIMLCCNSAGLPPQLNLRLTEPIFHFSRVIPRQNPGEHKPSALSKHCFLLSLLPNRHLNGPQGQQNPASGGLGRLLPECAQLPKRHMD